VNSGNVRSAIWIEGAQAYTRHGRCRQLASRLEGRTKYYGVGYSWKSNTTLVKDVVFKEIDRQGQGKDEAITIYEPVDLSGGRKAGSSTSSSYGIRRCGCTVPASGIRWKVNLLNLHRMNPGMRSCTSVREGSGRKRRTPRRRMGRRDVFDENSGGHPSMKLRILGCSGGIGAGTCAPRRCSSTTSPHRRRDGSRRPSLTS